VLSELGPVEIEVPRDRDASFDPVIAGKRARRLEGVEQIVLSLTARGSTTGEVAAHFAEVYSATVSRDTISAGSPTPCLSRWPRGRPGRPAGSTRWCSQARSWSRSRAGRSPTGRSRWQSA